MRNRINIYLKLKLVEALADMGFEKHYKYKGKLMAKNRSNTIFVIAKTPDAEEVLTVLAKTKSNPDFHGLNYDVPPEEPYSTAEFGVDFLKDIINFFDLFEEYIAITIKSEMPMILYNHHFEFILAPKVSDKENKPESLIVAGKLINKRKTKARKEMIQNEQDHKNKRQ